MSKYHVSELDAFLTLILRHASWLKTVACTSENKRFYKRRLSLRTLSVRGRLVKHSRTHAPVDVCVDKRPVQHFPPNCIKTVPDDKPTPEASAADWLAAPAGSALIGL